MDELSESRKQELRDEVLAYAKLGLARSYLDGLPEHERAYLMEWITEFWQAMSQKLTMLWDAVTEWVAGIMAVVVPVLQRFADWCSEYNPRSVGKPYGVTPMPRWLRATVRVRPILRLGKLGVDSG